MENKVKSIIKESVSEALKHIQYSRDLHTISVTPRLKTPKALLIFM